MKVLVTGGRDFDDAALLEARLSSLHKRRRVTLLIHGDADGADSIADAWAKANNVAVKRFPARWVDDDRRFDATAGFKRGVAMLAELGEGDLVLCTVGNKGTRNVAGTAAQMIANGTGKFDLKIINCNPKMQPRGKPRDKAQKKRSAA